MKVKVFEPYKVIKDFTLYEVNKNGVEKIKVFIGSQYIKVDIIRTANEENGSYKEKISLINPEIRYKETEKEEELSF